MEERIQRAIQQALAKMGAENIFGTLERPLKPSFGDYTTNVALIAAKTLGKPSSEVAFELAHSIRTLLGNDVSNIDVAGPGFVNITLSREVVARTVTEADKKGTGWGSSSKEEGKRIIVEYTDPNPFKEMHIGHLMSNAIGEAISRLIASEAATVIRANYQGDVGPHVARAIWGLKKAGIADPSSAKEVGEAYVAGTRAYEDSEEAKTEIDSLNQAIYAAEDPALMDLWRKGRDISLREFERLYRILGTHFDYFFFESETAEPGARMVRDGLTKGIFEESEGAVIYRGEKRGLHTLVFITSRGTPTYEAKDIGLAFLKEERIQNDKSIIVTSTEQIGHFKVFLAALADINEGIANKTQHVPHGVLRLSSGKMSSREGNTITANDLIQSVIEKASKKNEDPLVAEYVAIGAIKYMILRQAPGSDIVFDTEKSLSLEGDSGPYLQYALVRAQSVLTNAGQKEDEDTTPPDMPFILERHLIHFPEVVARAASLCAPNLLVTYLTELAGEWNSFYAQERIIGGMHEAYKLRLTRAFVHTMRNGLTFLGIPTPEKM